MLCPAKVVSGSTTLQIAPVSTLAQSVIENHATVILEPLNPILKRISKCESGDNPKAKNPYSSASGRFQFIKSSWEYYGRQLWGDDFPTKDVFDWEDNTELAIYVFNKNGGRDWSESAYCWDK